MGFPSLFAVRDRPGMGDFPRQIQQIRGTDITQHGVEQWIRLKHRTQAKAHRHDQHEKSAGNAEHVRNGAVKAEVHAGCQQHRVVWARRD